MTVVNTRHTPKKSLRGNVDLGRPFRQDRRRVFRTRDALTIFAFLAPACIIVAVFTYYPIINGIQIAFRRWNINDLSDTNWIGFGNFEDLFNDGSFGQLARQTLVWMVGAIVPQLLIGFALALALRNKFRGRGIYQAFVFFPWAMSGFVIGLIFRWMFNAEFGVINDLLIRTGIIKQPMLWLADPGLAMFTVCTAAVWAGVTFITLMILAALQAVPEELYEAAKLDGAGRMRSFFSITIPSIKITLLLVVLLTTIGTFNGAAFIYGVTSGGPGNSTNIITSYVIKASQTGDLGKAGAVGIIMFIILLLFAIFYLAVTRDRESKEADNA